jgi:hypothetical protein
MPGGTCWPLRSTWRCGADTLDNGEARGGGYGRPFRFPSPVRAAVTFCAHRRTNSRRFSDLCGCSDAVYFSDEDRKTYHAWLRRTALGYGALILLGIGVVATLALTNADSVAKFDPGAIGMTAP